MDYISIGLFKKKCYSKKDTVKCARSITNYLSKGSSAYEYSLKNTQFFHPKIDFYENLRRESKI